MKLRDILYGYQRKMAVCTKEEVGGLFYELSIFNLKPLVTPLRDTVEMVLRQVSGLMATNSWYPSFAEACSNIHGGNPTTSCLLQECPSISCPTADCPRQACATCPSSAKEKIICPLLWPYIAFGTVLGVSLCALLLVGWCGSVVGDCQKMQTVGLGSLLQLLG